jgi:hypothetical protein
VTKGIYSPYKPPSDWDWNTSGRPVVHGKTRRRRGTHSTKPKCENPVYFRPDNFKQLPGQLGHAYRRLTAKNRETGEVSLRIRVSKHVYFLALRNAVGRQRGFRPERQKLLDALFVLLISSCDIARHIVQLNVENLAKGLSPKDENGNVIPGQEVTPCRVSRLIQQLIDYGILSLPAEELALSKRWDSLNGHYFPKHVIITREGFKLTGIDLDKLYAEQEARLYAEAEGWVQPGEEISVKAARARWYEQMRYATAQRRREEAKRQKRINKLSGLSKDDRLLEMAGFLLKTLPFEEQLHMTADSLEKLAWKHLWQLDLALADPPD